MNNEKTRQTATKPMQLYEPMQLYDMTRINVVVVVVRVESSERTVQLQGV